MFVNAKSMPCAAVKPVNSRPSGVNATRKVRVEVRWLRLNTSNNSNKITDFLADDEVERARQIRKETTRNAFVQTRSALRSILGNHLNRPPAEIKFRYSKLGKPELDGNMHAEDNPIHFNVSHSREYALIAVCKGHRVGVDIECRLRDQLQYQKLARRYFSQQENAGLDSLAAEQRTHAFYTGWARKEAYAKALGMGIQIGLQSFDVSLLPTEPAQILNTRPDKNEARRWSLHDLPIDADYAAALAIECEPGNAQLTITQFCFS